MPWPAARRPASRATGEKGGLTTALCARPVGQCQLRAGGRREGAGPTRIVELKLGAVAHHLLCRRLRPQRDDCVSNVRNNVARVEVDSLVGRDGREVLCRLDEVRRDLNPHDLEAADDGLHRLDRVGVDHLGILGPLAVRVGVGVPVARRVSGRLKVRGRAGGRT